MPVNEIKQDNLNKSKFLLNSLFGNVVGIGTFLLTIIVFTFILTNSTNLDEKVYAFPMGCTALGLSSLVAGFITSVKNRSKGLISGILCSIMFFCVLFLVSLIILRSLRDSTIAFNMGFLKVLLIFAITLIPGTVGGVLGVNIIKKKR